MKSKHTIVLILILLIGITSLTAQNECTKYGNYFTNQEVDSIYNHLQRNLLLKKNNKALNSALQYSIKKNNTYKIIDSLYETKIQHLNTIISNKDLEIDFLLQKNKNNIKVLKRKKVSSFLKGSVVGAGIVLIFKIISN